MPKQAEIPGTERETIPEIEQAAEAYLKVWDRRMKLTEDEIAARTNLITVVKANAKKLTKNGEGALFYAYGDDMQVVIAPGKESVKVEHLSASDDDDDD